VSRRGPAGPASTAVAAALPGWALGRVMTVGALGVARRVVDFLHPVAGGVAGRAHEGLTGWDASWYLGIARTGYARQPREALRFFPLVPLLTRALAWLTRLPMSTSLLVVSNLSALVLGALLYHLAVEETGDDGLARRAAWLVALAPPAYTLVMGYAEATLGMLALGVFLALRSGRWWWAAALGVLAGLTRPIGALLVVPALIEAVGWSGPTMRQGFGPRRGGGGGGGGGGGRLAAVAGPIAGAGAFLTWAGSRFGDPFLPLSVQEERAHRGGFANPFSSLDRAVRDLSGGVHIGTGLHLPWAVLMVGLAVVAARRWPPAYGAFAVAVVVVALSAANLDSAERYALSAFPLVLAGAGLAASERVFRAVLALSSALLVAYATLAFLNLSVP